MNSTQHNESLEGVLGEKRPGRGGRTPVWTSEEPQEWLVELRGTPGMAGGPQRNPRNPRKSYIWRPQVSSPQCNILHAGTSFHKVLSLEQFPC